MCLVQDGKPLPPLRFYAGEPICNMEKCDKVVLIASEIHIPSELNLPLSSGIIDWIEDSGVSSTIMVDSFAHGIESLHSIFDEDPGTDSILGLGSTDSTHDLLKGIGVPLLKQGVVGGMTGVMMGECRRRGLTPGDTCRVGWRDRPGDDSRCPCSSGDNRMLRRTSACSPSGSGTPHGGGSENRGADT